MNYPRVLTIQDISCFGQCSTTVALPIISACGVETAILPSAILSTHTGGFKNYTFRDLTSDMLSVKNHWLSENISFDSIYTGYLGNIKQIEIVKEVYKDVLKPNHKLIVDPAMADNGVLYPPFDNNFVLEMKKLVDEADIIIPNITEASLLTNFEYLEEYDESYIYDLCSKLSNKPHKTVIITGVGYVSDKTGVAVFSDNKLKYYEHEKISKGSHGTGDVFASAFVGSYMKGLDTFDAVKIAADYTLECIKLTYGDETHKYGVKFELGLKHLINSL